MAEVCQMAAPALPDPGAIGGAVDKEDWWYRQLAAPFIAGNRRARAICKTRLVANADGGCMNQKGRHKQSFGTAFLLPAEAILLLLTRILPACYLAVRWRFGAGGAMLYLLVCQ